MIRKLIVAGALLSFTAGTALAATEYFVAHQPDSTKCVVTQGKPDGKTWIQVGDAYQSQKAAQKAIKSAAECKK
jgi:hypothetical protein